MAGPTPSSLILSRHDIRFLLEEWLDVNALTNRPRHAGQSVDEYRVVLDLAEEIAADRFAPHNRAGDDAEPHIVDGHVVLVPEIKEALDAYAEAGLLGATLDESVGGLQLPSVVGSAVLAWFFAANVGTANYASLTIAAASMLAECGSEEQIARWVEPLAAGRFHGTMCLSEPQAGSSLADISTRAEPQADGTYRLTGAKMWISGGEHDLAENIVHLVLAKIPGGPAGVKGISLFVVPRRLVADDGSITEWNDIVLGGVNHKVGQRGTVNTVLNLGDGAHTPNGQPGAVGYLVGEPHQGLVYMFHMMNEARIAVGLGAAALGYTAYLKACKYARERPQGRPVGAKDPTVAPVAIIEHADVKRMLLAQKSYVEGALALVLYSARLVDETQSLPEGPPRERAQLLLDLLTPLAKSWPSQWALEANSLAIQVHGGYGYSREYDLEQHWRDNRLNMIHEGTHGIQALDLLGRKVTMRDGAAFQALMDAIRLTIERAEGSTEDARALARELARYTTRLREVTTLLSREPDRSLALANATIYLEACGHVVVAWLWLEQYLAAADRDDPFYAGKRQATHYFFRYELPRTAPQFDLLAARDRTALDLEAAWL